MGGGVFRLSRFWWFAAALLVTVMMSSAVINGYVDTATPHVKTLFYTDATRSGMPTCRYCHAGILGGTSKKNMDPVEVSRVAENYRCIVCHLDATQPVVYAVARSPHRSIGCTYCHDTLHWGHSGYDTAQRGLYGCVGGCHMITVQDYDPPAGADALFGDAYRGVETGDVSPPTSLARFFTPTATGAATKEIYPDAYADPYTGDYDAIPAAKSYWVCLKCHFVEQAPSRSTATDTYWVTHPDVCYNCHTNTTGLTSAKNLDPHAVDDEPENYSWEACGSCHTNLAQAVSGSVHGPSGIGCRCHSVIHFSMYNGSASWVYIYPSPATGDYVSPATPITDLSQWRTVFHYDQTNASTYSAIIDPLSVAGETRYAGIYYLMRSGDATPITGPEMRWATCLNCHFIAGTSGAASPLTGLGGSVPLPEEGLRSVEDPHRIHPAVPAGGAEGRVAGRLITFMLVVLLASATALAILVWQAGYSLRR